MKKTILIKYILIICLLYFTAFSCSSLRDSTHARSDISPGYARVVLSIIEIDSTIVSDNPKDPCSKAPCSVKARIDSLVGYGSSFRTVFSKGEIINVKFVYTVTKTTEEILPNFPKSYPGVVIGTKILADVESRSKMNTDLPDLLVYGYEIKNK